MLTRPPPLQLLFDNTRPGLRSAPQPQPEPKPAVQSECFSQIYAFAGQVYQANWRNLVIAVAAINALRFLISAVRTDIDFDHIHKVPKLAQFSIALGALYLATALIQIFGALSAALERLTLIRVYVHLAFVSALLITAAGFVTGVEYFLLAEDIITECVALSVSGSWISKSIFRGKLSHGKVPSIKVAEQQCLAAWSRGSFSQVVAIFAFSLIPAIAFFLLAYTYYRQTTDPTHPASLTVARPGDSDALRMAYPGAPGFRYSPLYNTPRNGERRGAPDVLARPQMRTKHQRPVMLQVSAVMHSAYSLTPGPPSFAPRRAYGYEHGPAYLGVPSDEGRLV
ncbi:hypothetical protein LshimejAT787_0701320 [Lyophyllum shimeji]|uniref:Transmembrane protein n=1 Tax=Lyophyllum shimeji TaxID=47721 RepID=A0A9P3PNE8_LYOSH|nr:hypothetical protein LshimejAT787_0701320 [Lyophyllum shimeji]